jgi:fumarate reductase flavoprotein subunit
MAILVLIFLVFGCTGTPKTGVSSYTSTVQGFGGDISVVVTIEEGRIISVIAEGPGETTGVGAVAISTLPGRIVENQSLAIDTISGATISSTGILSAVEDCLVQAGLDPSKYQTKALAAQSLRTFTADVVVVGTGISGMSAIVSAAQNGAKVVALEKQTITGGSAKFSLGAFMVAEIDENRQFQISSEADTLAAALDRWRRYQTQSRKPSQYPDYDRLRFQLVQTMFTINWMQQFGALFTPRNPMAYQGMTLLQTDAPVENGEQMLKAGKLMAHMKGLAERMGAQFIMEAPAYQIIVESGKVAGVRARSPQSEVEVRAPKVILATGSYSVNYDMVKRTISDMYAFYSTGAISNVGEGIQMALDIGAVLYEDPFVHPAWPCPAKEFIDLNPQALVFMHESSPIKDVSESSYYRLMVDKNAQRFQNEGGPYAYQVLNMVYNKQYPYWVLYDNLSRQVAAIAESGIPTGKVVKGNTINEVAQKAGLNPVVFEATVARYRQMVQQGEDTDFQKNPTYLKALGTSGPFYLIETIPAGVDILGGIKTNYDQQVLRGDDSIIAGLYAVGSMSNRQYYNQYYFSGSALTFSATAGRIAGAHAARN